MRPSAIKEIARAQGRELRWLAARMGVGYTTLINVELGRTIPPAGYYERAAQVLGVPLRLVLPPDSVPEPAA
jgi:transcriptional regulator with XRE-family HTH domain